MDAHPAMIKLGVDIGSRNTKLVILDASRNEVMFAAWRATEVDPRESVQALLAEAETALGPFSAAASAATGYGRKLYATQYQVKSEISCHAAGVLFSYPRVRTIIDVGGQDSKVITLDDRQKVADFAMNDKCAAGTGRFLEMTAMRLTCSLDGLSKLAASSSGDLSISSTCVVFAESEIISLLSGNASAEDIARAVHRSIAKRIVGQLSSLDYAPPFAFTGGVAQNSDLVRCLADELRSEIFVPPDPEITGALGAALLA